MVEAEKLSLLETRAEAVKRWMDEEEVLFAKHIEREVNNFLSPFKYALPPQFALNRPKKPTELEGRFFGNYIEYDVENGSLSKVTEEYFDSGSEPPVFIRRKQLPVTAWTKQRRDQVINTAMTFLPPQSAPQGK